jgi:ATP-binding cassette subfamily A (ABC1) protein 5
MDEADKLAHRIGILVNGRLEALGSSQELKAKFGDAYSLEVRASSRAPGREVNNGDGGDGGDGGGSETMADAFLASLSALQPSARLVARSGDVLSLEIPRDASTYGQLFADVEQARHCEVVSGHGGGGVQGVWDAVEEYSISQASLESVFLSLSKNQIDPDE